MNKLEKEIFGMRIPLKEKMRLVELLQQAYFIGMQETVKTNEK